MASRKIVPIEELEDLLQDFGDAVERQTTEGKAFAQLMDVVEAKAVELAPVDTGELEGSSSTRVQRVAGRVVGTLRFGAPHAARAHELPPNQRGPKTRAKPGNEFGPAGPKYVERVLRGFQARLTQDVGVALQSALRRVKVRRRSR